MNLSTQVIVEISKDQEIEFRERFDIVFPTITGQCLNTKDFQLVKEALVAQINNSLNSTEIVSNFLDDYSDIINGSQKRQLLQIIKRGIVSTRKPKMDGVNRGRPINAKGC